MKLLKPTAISTSHYQPEAFYKYFVGIMKIKKDQAKIATAMYHLASNVRPFSQVVKKDPNRKTDVKDRAIDIEKGVFIESETPALNQVPPLATKENYKLEHWVLFGAYDPTAFIPKDSFKNPSLVPMMTAGEMAPDLLVIANALRDGILSSDNVKMFASIALKTFNHGNLLGINKTFELQALREQVKQMTETATATMTDDVIRTTFKELFPCIITKGFSAQGDKIFQTLRKIVDLNDEKRKIEKDIKKQEGAKPDKPGDKEKPENKPENKPGDKEKPENKPENKPGDNTTKPKECDKIRIVKGVLQAKNSKGTWEPLKVYYGGDSHRLISPGSGTKCATGETLVEFAECTKRANDKKKCNPPFEGTVLLKDLYEMLAFVTDDDANEKINRRKNI